MDEKKEQNLRVIDDSRDTRDKEVFVKKQPSHQTNPIVRKLLDFSSANNTRKFSIRDLFTR